MVVRILRDERRWWYVRLSCPCGCSRTASGATLAAAVSNFRYGAKVNRYGALASRGLGEMPGVRVGSAA